MTYLLERPGFALRVCGGFVESGQWLIHGVVEYQPHLAVDSANDVEAEARRELMLAISRASHTARARGARSVYVVVDGDDEVAGFFRLSNRRASRSGTTIVRDRVSINFVGV
jgi:hypothetical protein